VPIHHIDVQPVSLRRQQIDRRGKVGKVSRKYRWADPDHPTNVGGLCTTASTVGVVTKRVVLGEFLLAVEGLALARNLFDGTNEHTNERIGEMIEILERMHSDGDAIEKLSILSDELGPLAGYALWAASYDDAANPLIDVEQPALEALLGTIPVGRAVDVCCGTGRIAKLLVDRGHQVIAVDQSKAMLDKAQLALPDTTVVAAPLSGGLRYTVGSGFDLVTCGLALTHFESLDGPVSTLAALARPGGDLVFTDVHPFYTAIRTQAFFNADDGVTPFVRNYAHNIGDYLRAFAAAGLDVVHCIEPVPAIGEGPMRSLVGTLRPAAAQSAYEGIPTAIIWHLRKR
jgi:SAM-dependent methyltransferase